MLTPRQFAERNSVAYTTVISWLNKQLLPGAEKEDLAYGGFMWLVPEDTPVPSLKPGPVPAPKVTTAVKPAKKRAMKKGN